MSAPAPPPPHDPGAAPPHADGGSVTCLIDDLKSGDPASTEKIWGRFYRRMAEYSRRRLLASPCRVADEEDVALSAFQSFVQALGDGQFPWITSRGHLWAALSTITSRKTSDYVTHERRIKRGGRAEFAEHDDLKQVVGPDRPPDEVVAAAEDVQRMLDRLEDPVLQRIAVLRLEGHTADEIGRLLGCTSRTVERKIRMIRCLLAKAGT